MPISEAFRRRGATLAFTAALAAFAGAAFYLPAIDTGFASEDFLVLGHLSRESLLETLRHEVSSPWLGLAPVGFWRPVSTVLLALELRAFGLHPARFHLFHVLLHAVNAWLVATIVASVLGWQHGGQVSRDHALARPGDRTGWLIPAAAGLFAIHPFHPSAVIFTGAFATLHAATLSLLAVRWFLSARQREATGDASRRLDLAAILCFVLAVGCYEAAVVVPAVLLVAILLFRDVAPADPSRRGALASAARRLAPYFVVVVVYFAIRLLVLGTTVGGYAPFRARFFSSLPALIVDFVLALSTILHPQFRASTYESLVSMVWALALAPALIIGRGRGGRPLLAGLAWTALSLAPFAFVHLVPANGRYAYFAIAGVVLAICGLAAPIVARWPRAGALAMGAAIAILGADWFSALRPTVDAYERASALVAALRADVIGVAAEHAAGDRVLLVEDPPDFVKGEGLEPVAKVLQYGLAESVQPPFGPLTRSPIPLGPAIGKVARAALGARPDTVRYRWSSYAELVPVAQEPAPVAALAIGPFHAAHGRLDNECDDCAKQRFFILTSALPFVIAPDKVVPGEARYQVSSELLRGLDRLGDGPAFFWIEEGDGFETTAISPIARFELGDATRSFAEAAAKIRRDSGGDDDSGLEGLP